jgi:chromosome segregation protein
MRWERERLAAETPERLRATAEAAEETRRAAEVTREGAQERFAQAATRRDAAAMTDRQATGAENAANREWREASTELDRLREEYEEEDRARGDIERRITDAERLVREGHGRDPEEALAALTETDIVPELERRSELVARRLGLLGRVNLLATGEFEALQERHDFMQRELDDIRKARRDLLEVIRRVDDEVILLFDAAYRDVAAEFEAMFKELFPGGEGQLILTDPANLLETGIEVEARPGRKRVKRLSLLSGGERALTALTFLFSIFKARPSPFYLLDEVEPALDDVNLHRFLGLIKGFARDAQVILVTHQKRTMEIADMLYGVSMMPDGSSRVVCQRLDHGKPIEIRPIVVSKADSVV